MVTKEIKIAIHLRHHPHLSPSDVALFVLCVCSRFYFSPLHMLSIRDGEDSKANKLMLRCKASTRKAFFEYVSPSLL